MAKHQDMDRRDFLNDLTRGTAVAGAGLLVASSAYARKSTIPTDPHLPTTGTLLNPDDTIGIGIIGVGGMGSGHLGDLLSREKNGQNIQVRAISDVYTRRQKNALKRVEQQTGRTIEAYFDYTQLLERDDIHAVVIATPDHWHALNAIHALQAGKDVYCQKPITHTIEEAYDLRETVYKTGRVFQCGAQRCSDDFFWQARDFIQQGGIGKLLWVQADYSRNSKGGPDDRGGEWNYHIDADATNNPDAGDAYIDWRQWLGPAKRRDFSPPRFFQFRKFWDYSGGIATDLLYHYIAPLTIALGTTTPERVSANGGIWIQKDDREVPDTFMMNLDYPQDFSMTLTSSMANAQANPLMIRGHRATIRHHESGGMHVSAEKQFEDWFKKEHGANEIIVDLQPRDDHMTNWLKCIKTREKCHLDIDTACDALVVTRLGIESYRQDKILFWDHEEQRQTRKHPRPHRDSKYPVQES